METSYGKKPLRQSLSNLLTIKYSDSGEDIPTGYQKIPYHIAFDLKYDLRHKERLVSGGNWNVNDKEDIYSGVVRMHTVRIGFSQEICMDFHVVHVASLMPSYMEKQSRKSIELLLLNLEQLYMVKSNN
jgi:hypothetical protein